MDELDEDVTEAGRSAPRAGWPLDPHRLWRAVWAGKRRLIIAATAGLIVGFAVAKLLLVSGYETTALLRYEGELDLPGLPPSRDAIGPAASALAQPAVRRQIREQTSPDGSGIGGTTASYEIDYPNATMSIHVGGATGEEAAARARLVTNVFLAYHKERQARRIEDEIARIRKRIEAAQREAEESRRAYNAFREEHGIADLSTDEVSMMQSAARLQADSELAGSEVRALEAQIESLQAQLATIPKTSVVSSGSPERAAYNRLREELASARATLSEDHPRVQSLQQQVNQLGSQLGRGSSRGSMDGIVSVNSTYQAVEEQLRGAKARLVALKERQKGISDMADRAKSRVDTFSEVAGEAAGLLARVTVDDNLVGSLRRTEAALEDALRDPPSGFEVLDPGAVPEYPVRNKMKLVVFAAVPTLAVGFVLLLILRRELRGLRVQTPAEVAFWGKGPVLGATSWPDDPAGLDELVAGLDDFAPDARGTLLLVGGSEEDSGRAAELAERINEDWLPGSSAVAPRVVPSTAPRSGPLQTPPPAPPSGPYPVGPRSESSRSTALVRIPAPPPKPVRLVPKPDALRLEAWDGPYEGQALRRAARLADRVIVLIRSGAVSATRLHAVENRLGRAKGVGYILIGLPEDLRALPDRVGDVAGFWKGK